MRKALAVLAASIIASSGPSHADHADVMDFAFGGALRLSLEDFDECLFDGTEVRAFADMTATCQTTFEPCHSRMHLAEGEVPRDRASQVFLERCLQEDSGRFHVLLQRHTLDVLGTLPWDADEDARADVVERLVRAPQAEAAEAYEACLDEAGEGAELAHLACARDWRFDQLLRSRMAARGEQI